MLNSLTNSEVRSEVSDEPFSMVLQAMLVEVFDVLADVVRHLPVPALTADIEETVITNIQASIASNVTRALTDDMTKVWSEVFENCTPVTWTLGQEVKSKVEAVIDDLYAILRSSLKADVKSGIGSLGLNPIVEAVIQDVPVRDSVWQPAIVAFTSSALAAVSARLDSSVHSSLQSYLYRAMQSKVSLSTETLLAVATGVSRKVLTQVCNLVDGNTANVHFAVARAVKAITKED